MPLACHGFIYAWYVAVFEALRKNDDEKLKLLYECALTCTVQVWATSSTALLAEVSIKHSEKVRSEAQVDTDSFLVFARKVLLVAASFGAGGASRKPGDSSSGVSADKIDIKKLQKFDLRFHGGQFNATMLSTMKAMKPILESEQCMSLISALDREYGQGVLTGSYNKLKLFHSCIKGNTDTGAWVLETMLTALRRRETGLGV